MTDNIEKDILKGSLIEEGASLEQAEELASDIFKTITEFENSEGFNTTESDLKFIPASSDIDDIIK